jgi:AraC family transcriptional regulator
MREPTLRDWHRRVDLVLQEILAQLDRPQALDRLAARAAASPWHFHRTFRELTGESLDACVRRLRLERAAWQLRQPGSRVTDVALDAGFGSPEAFTRAFTRAFGLGPSRQRRLPAWHGSLPSAAGIHYRGGGPKLWHFISPDPEDTMQTKIVHLPPRRIFALEFTGNPWELPHAWQRFRALPGVPELAGPGSQWLSVFYDQHGGLPLERRRHAAAMVPADGAECPAGLAESNLPGGRYAVVLHFGSSEEIGLTVEHWEKDWLPASSWEPDPGRPCWEWYQTGPAVPPELSLTFWCSPVKDRKDDQVPAG